MTIGNKRTNADSSGTTAIVDEPLAGILAELDAKGAAIQAELERSRDQAAREQVVLDGLLAGSAIPALLDEDRLAAQRRSVRDADAEVSRLERKRDEVRSAQIALREQRILTAAAESAWRTFVAGARQFEAALEQAQRTYRELLASTELLGQLAHKHHLNDVRIGSSRSLVEMPVPAGEAAILTGPWRQVFGPVDPGNHSRFDTLRADLRRIVGSATGK